MPLLGSAGPGDPAAGMPLPPAVTQRTVLAGTGDEHASPAPPFRTGMIAAAATPALASPAAEEFAEVPWAPMSEDEEGEVAAVFEEDVALTTEEILASARPRTEEFNVDAFIIPEDSTSVPTGLDAAQVEAVKHHSAHPPHDAAHDVADRFERLSRRLRTEGLDSLLPSLARGDTFDSMLAGFLAGYLSAKSST